MFNIILITMSSYELLVKSYLLINKMQHYAAGKHKQITYN